MTLDWHFISRLEGGRHTRGYVPEGGKSGVTVATGFDIGQWSEAEILALGLGADLAGRLLPYCRLKGAAAGATLSSRPLAMTEREAMDIDAAVRARFEARIARSWDMIPAARPWGDLDRARRTVVLSVAFQHGPNLVKAAPRFWTMATRGDWRGVEAELRDFGDDFPTRRRAEADYLAGALAILEERET